jgi:hypothetical protein
MSGGRNDPFRIPDSFRRYRFRGIWRFFEWDVPRTRSLWPEDISSVHDRKPRAGLDPLFYSLVV